VLLIKGGRVVDPANGLEGPKDILIEGGRIAGVLEPGTGPAGAQVIDASGRLVVPGLVDIHCHLREPGYEWKEDIESGTKAAAAGGFTSVCCMANTNPVNDNASVCRFIVRRAEEAGRVNVFPVGAISKGQKGEELAEMGELKLAGAVAVSDDGKPVQNAELMRRALEYASVFGLKVMPHCEEPSLSAGRVMNEGLTSAKLGLKGIPSAAEELMVHRDVTLAGYVGTGIHIQHISTLGSVNILKEAKSRGIKATCEVTPHHFTLTEEAVAGYDTDTKANPPLRTRNDLEAIHLAMRDGTIDCIATDHAPHELNSKNVEFSRAAFGISGLETALALGLKLVAEGKLSLKRLIEMMTTAPARIVGLDRGTLSIGAPADITIIDTGREFTVDPVKFCSKGRNTPFKGWKLKGMCVMTMVGGKVVYEAKS
jgi:dihydroorotase